MNGIAHWRRQVACLASILVVSSVAVACGSGGGGGGSGSSNTLLIGVSEPLTGVGAAPGQGIVNAIKLALPDVEKLKGLAGRHIKLLVEDNATDPATCASVAQKLVSQGVVAIIGGWSSACTLAMEPITSRAHVPLLVETSSSDKVTAKSGSGNAWTFRISATSGMETVALSKLFAAEGVHKVYMLAENTDFGLGANSAYTTMFKSIGADVVGTATFAMDAQSFSSQVTRAVHSGADTWVVTSEAPQIAAILREARGEGSHARVVATGGSNFPAQIVELAGSGNADGLQTTMYFPAFDPSLAGNPTLAAQFVMQWKAHGYDPNVIAEAARGYSAMNVLGDALARAKDPSDRSSVATALGQTNMDTIIYGHVRFETWCDHINQNEPEILLTKVVDNKVQLAAKNSPPYACPK